MAVTIRRNPTDDGIYYWRASTHDRIDLTGWSHVDVDLDRRPDGRADLRPARRRRRSGGSPQLHVHRDAGQFQRVDDPVAADADQRRPGGPTDDGRRGRLLRHDRSHRGERPVHRHRAHPGQWQRARTAEPRRHSARRTPPTRTRSRRSTCRSSTGPLGPNALALEAKIRDEAASEAPIDLVNQIVAELHSSAYQYQTDVRDVPCAGLSTVECFATYKKGFCQYYAPTMAVILRHMGIPTRIAEGFLPGARDRNAATEQIPFSNAHAWVEVYFPGYGWLTFDPTGGNVSQLAPLADGQPDREWLAAADPQHRRRPRPLPTERDEGGAGVGVGPFGGGPASLGPLVAVLALLLLVVGGRGVPDLAARAARRDHGRRRLRDGHPDRVAVRLRAAADPDGLRVRRRPRRRPARPSDPSSRPSPGPRSSRSMPARSSASERLASLKAAQRRLRVGLLRLAFRRKERRRRR